jgi:hypothetical protein
LLIEGFFLRLHGTSVAVYIGDDANAERQKSLETGSLRGMEFQEVRIK